MSDIIQMRFTGNEILDIALKMEEIGASFYINASENVSDDVTRQVLIRLSEMELQHKKRFESLRNCFMTRMKKLVESEPESPILHYLHSWLEGQVFKRENLDEFFASDPGLDEIIWKAIGMEKDSIAFYSGLKDMVSKEESNIINRIIQEELVHLVDLGRLKRSKTQLRQFLSSRKSAFSGEDPSCE